jgi:hypothetical protein
MREPRDVDGHDSWMERRNLTKRVQTWTWEVAGKQTDKQCQLADHRIDSPDVDAQDERQMLRRRRD